VLKVTCKDPRLGPLRFTVHAKPRAKKSAILGVANEELDMALAAPPVDGAANDELVRSLSDALGLPKRSVVIVRGESSRHKLVEVSGLTLDELMGRLGLA
jgi:uncharacterized protein (TIGR00251 family)